jgi:hypothetical protein
MITIDGLVRGGGAAVCAGGVLSAIGAVGHDFVDDKAVNPGLTVVSTVGIVGGLLLLLGLPIWYAVQARAAGRFGLVAFLMVYVGWAGLQVGTQPLYDYLAPALYARPGNADLAADGALEEVATSFLAYVVITLVALNLGLLLFGIVMLRARVFPRLLSAMVAVGPLAVFFLAAVEEEVIGVLLVAIAACGFLIATGRVRLAGGDQPAPIGRSDDHLGLAPDAH